MQILLYLYDWLCALTQEQAIYNTMAFLAHVTQLRVTVNFVKSSLVFSQRVVFIGVALDSVLIRASFPLPRGWMASLFGQTTPQQLFI